MATGPKTKSVSMSGWNATPPTSGTPAGAASSSPAGGCAAAPSVTASGAPAPLVARADRRASVWRASPSALAGFGTAGTTAVP
eukprot:14055056-Alexandrium_andersonii.AAC.1